MKKSTRNIVIIVFAITAAIAIVLAIVLPLTLKKDKYHTVTFNSNGGTVVESITNVEHNSTIDEPTAPTRSGYVFDGWYKDVKLTEKWTFATDKVKSDITLYAKWNYNATMGLSMTNRVTHYTVAGIGNAVDVSDVIIPEINGNLPVTAIENGAFSNLPSIASVYIPASVDEVGYQAFSGCANLVSIVFAGEEVSVGERAFYNCEKLQSVTLPSQLKQIDSETFYGCGDLTNVTIPASVEAIGSKAFYGCGNLQAFAFHDGLTSIGDMAFSGCVKFTEVKLPKSLKTLGTQAFSGCSSLEKLDVERGNEGNYYSEGNCILHTEVEGTSTINVIVVGCKSSVIPAVATVIGKGAFNGCSGLTGYFEIPANITRIEDQAFLGCENLTRVDVSASVTYIGHYAFSDCRQLQVINFGTNGNTSALSGIGIEAFSYCYNLTSVSIPKTVKSIGVGAFYKDQPGNLMSVYFYGSTAEFRNIDIVDTLDGTEDTRVDAAEFNALSTIHCYPFDETSNSITSYLKLQ